MSGIPSPHPGGGQVQGAVAPPNKSKSKTHDPYRGRFLVKGFAFGRGFALAVLSLSLTGAALAQTEGAPMAPDGTPTYKAEGNKVDKGTFNGFRRYHNSCHVCHGPDGMGGSFAPNLTESLKALDYYKFTEIVVNGKQSAGATGDRVMPSFGTDPNVMDNLDDIYRYLKARSDDKLGRGRPERMPG